MGMIRKDLREVKNEMVGVERRVAQKNKKKAEEGREEKEEMELG